MWFLYKMKMFTYKLDAKMLYFCVNLIKQNKSPS